MKARSLATLFFSFLLVLVSVDQADAQRRGNRRAQLAPEDVAKNRTEEMKKVMTLSDEQVEKVKDINLTYAEKIAELRSEAANSRDRRAMMEAMRPVNEEWDKEIKALVTEVQWEKWAEHVEKQRQNRRRGRPN